MNDVAISDWLKLFRFFNMHIIDIKYANEAKNSFRQFQCYIRMCDGFSMSVLLPILQQKGFENRPTIKIVKVMNDSVYSQYIQLWWYIEAVMLNSLR